MSSGFWSAEHVEPREKCEPPGRLMAPTFVRVDLPGGLRLHAPNRSEARMLYHEIFEAGAYDKHGVSVRDCDCVFDVGANIGVFSVYLARRHRGLRLYAFEPVPDVFRLLSLNAKEHLGDAVRLFEYGLSSARQTVTFRYDPAFTLGTTCRSDDVHRSRRRGVRAIEWARAVATDLGRSGQIGPADTRFALRALATPMLNLATASLMRAVAAAIDVMRTVRTRDVIAEVRPLSAVVREEGIERIDLLKIDVEGAEWEVLRGIDDEHWPRIRQIVIEVHDVDGRVGKVRELLASKGYDVVVDRQDWALHVLLGIHTLFARRGAAPGPTT